MSTYASGEYAAQLLRLSQLAVNVLTKPQDSGRQDLGDLISTAASFRVRGERENDPIMAQASRVAYNAASETFKKYGEYLMQSVVNKLGYVDFETSRIMSRLIFCEYEVSDFVSLEELEFAAQKAVDDREEAAITILTGMKRALKRNET